MKNATRHYLLDARTATPHFPGIGRYVRNLAQALAPQLAPDERLALVWNSADPDAWDPAQLAHPQVETQALPVSPFSPAQQWRMPGLLGRISAPLLYHSTYYLMPYRPGVPTLLTVYDLLPLLHPQIASPRARLFFRISLRLALRAAQQVVAISAATQQDLLRYFSLGAERVATVPLAADPRFRPQPPAAVEQARRKYSLPERYVFYLGINKPHKNLVRLVDAYAGLAPHHPPLVIGGAWDARYPQPRERVEQQGLAGRIRFLGPVDDADLPALYSSSTLFVFPSLYEGFGLPVLEAMACGAPVACSNASSLPEVAGDAALLFDPRDVTAIATTIRHALEDGTLRHSLSARGLRQAQLFSWQRTARETLALYRRMVY